MPPASAPSRLTISRPAISSESLAGLRREKAGRKLPFSAATVVAVVAGLAAGLALAIVPARWIEQTAARSDWPRSGLVVYANPAQSSISIEDASGTSFTLGRTGANGSVSIPDLPPGVYRVLITSPGFRSLEKDVEISKEKAVVLGFPSPIQLAQK